jgi:hypothetical protein
MNLRVHVLGFTAVLMLTACDNVPSSLGGYTYRAEIGYYEGDKQTWFVGTDKSREACISEAISRYSSINAASPRRAFSWACRQMQGEEFLDRVR